jgi:ATP phosphoribosyltransferase
MTLSIALPNKGALAEGAAAIFREAGYSLRKDSRELSFIDAKNDIEFFYLRPRDIATYVASGDLDLGITGRDLLLDSGVAAVERIALDFGRSEFRFASPIGQIELSGKRIATSYPKLVSDHLEKLNLSALIIELDGAVEGAIKLGLADLIADVVATGNTLKQAGLTIFGDVVMRSEAILISRPGVNTEEIEKLSRRVTGVVIARQYVLVDYDIEEAKLERACSITPGLESPTISPLRKSGWYAVRAMVKRDDVHEAMDQLWEIGARGILVTDIHSSRL